MDEQIMRNLMQMLISYEAKSQIEELYKEAMILFLFHEHLNAFSRNETSRHFTSSALIINKDNTKALLLKHKKLNMWLQPGGHCDGNPDVLAVALKEAYEETNINSLEAVTGKIFDIDIHQIPEHISSSGIVTPSHFHYDIRFLIQVKSDEQGFINNESTDIKWIEKDISQLETNSPGTIRLFTKWINS